MDFLNDSTAMANQTNGRLIINETKIFRHIFAPVPSQEPLAFVCLACFFLIFVHLYVLEFRMKSIFTELVQIFIQEPAEVHLQGQDFLAALKTHWLAFDCYLLFGRVVVSQTYSPFSFSVSKLSDFKSRLQVFIMLIKEGRKIPEGQSNSSGDVSKRQQSDQVKKTVKGCVFNTAKKKCCTRRIASAVP